MFWYHAQFCSLSSVTLFITKCGCFSYHAQLGKENDNNIYNMNVLPVQNFDSVILGLAVCWHIILVSTPIRLHYSHVHSLAICLLTKCFAPEKKDTVQFTVTKKKFFLSETITDR